MKTGDLVQVRGIKNQPTKPGLIIGQKVFWSSTRFPVLIDGKVLYPTEEELTLIEEMNETR